MTLPHRRALSALALPCLLLTSGPAGARPQPPAPPSGIVVHLFGPDSIANQVLPGSPPARPSGGGEQAGGQQAGSRPAGTIPAYTQDDPENWGSIAHQMFVTGNPAQEGRAALPKGKSAP